MLAKILEDMWVEPEVLEALSEEQKRILFLKMREEQVRRWREREEQEEQEEQEEKEGRLHSNRPKKADNKHVRWLLGRDGDVSVSVIGDQDEFRSSKLLHSLRTSRVQGDGVTEDETSGRDQDVQLALSAVTGPGWSEDDSGSADDDPKDPGEDSDSESGVSSDGLSDWTPIHRPRPGRHGNRPPLRAQLSDAERRQNKGPYGGRVAQLRKTFMEDPQSPPHCSKPPVPTKPDHLRKTTRIH